MEYDIEVTCSRLVLAGLPQHFADYLRTGANAPDRDDGSASGDNFISG